MANTIHPSIYLTEVEQNESSIRYGKAWLRAFLSAPHLTPSNPESTLYRGMKQFLQLSPLLTEDMIPDVFTKLYGAHQNAEPKPEILVFALKHFMEKYPHIAAFWAANRLDKDKWISSVFSDMGALHMMGINIPTVPSSLLDKTNYKHQIWPTDIISFGPALYAVRNEAAWKPLIPKIVLKLIEDGAKRMSRYDSDHPLSSRSERDAKYCLNQVFNMLEPFWEEPVFLKALDKARKSFNAKNYEDIARFITSNSTDSKRVPLPDVFVRKLLGYCMEQLNAQLSTKSTEDIDNSKLVIVLANTINAGQKQDAPWFDEMHQRFQEALVKAVQDFKTISKVLVSPMVLHVVGSALPDVWNSHMTHKHGPFGDESVIRFVNENYCLALLNTITPSVARDFIVEKMADANPQTRMWEKLLTYFKEEENLGFSDELRQALAEHPIVKQKLLHYFALENSALPNGLSMYRMDDGWSPPEYHPLVNLMHNIYPEKHDVWVDLLCHYIEYPREFTDHAFSTVLTALTGKNNPTLEQAKALSDTLGFTLEEFLGTLCAKPLAGLSEEELSIPLMHDDGSFPV